MQRGLAYADELKLLRAQLLNAISANGIDGNYLLRSLREAGRMSSWHQAVIGHLLCEMQGGSRRERVQEAARLVAAEGRTPSQLLGAAIDLAGCGLVGSAAHAIQRLMQQVKPPAAPCLELCALLVGALKMPMEAQFSPQVSSHRHWSQMLAIQPGPIRSLSE